MTGMFAKAARASECVSMHCRTVIQAGELVYLFMKHERQTVCLDCAEKRWGYRPSDPVPVTTTPTTHKPRIGFDSAKSILQSLQRQANANDPKLRQSGGDR